MRERNAKRKITAIVPSAGKGKRFNSGVNKVIADLNGKPLLSYSLKSLELSPSIDSIILVGDRDSLKVFKKLVKRYRFSKVDFIVEGGRTRTESVYKGLDYVSRDTGYVLIHDGARPLLSASIIKDTVNAAIKYGAAVSAVPVKNTVKFSTKGQLVEYTPDRRRLWEVHTPQVFKRSILEGAYQKIRGKIGFTDDAVLVEKIGGKIKIVHGDYKNIKITTKSDIVLAKALLKYD